ncbi:F-box protein At1g61340-like [Benincasa hispida]|uniref:F-box protein At1g61340-like n=1 Tax=Benincasa hispida TaxID=102211 RepID=UPI0019003125|nr:F-box protein At1g61340-like [Benincasa hispida]
MGLGRRSRSVLKYNRSPKRVMFSSDDEKSTISSGDTSLLEFSFDDEKSTISSGDTSLLEDLPQDLLIRVFCGVEHGDLKNLLRISKTISEAALSAKKMAF